MPPCFNTVTRPSRKPLLASQSHRYREIRKATCERIILKRFLFISVYLRPKIGRYQTNLAPT
jgi:hypothetical protein